MKTPLIRSLRTSWLIVRSLGAAALCSGALLLGAAGCDEGSDIQCGPDTRLDAKTNECVPDLPPDFNIIVDDFHIGNFDLTDVDVPEQLQVGTPNTRTFTITNRGTDDRPVVLIRYAIAPVESTIDELRDAIDEMSDGSELDATFLGLTILKDLKAGESRSVEYYLGVPNTVADGLYGFMFAIDEVPLTDAGDGQYVIDYSADGMAKADKTGRLGNAALVYAPATVIVGKPDRPNLRVLFAKTDNASFELDQTEEGKIPMFTLSARMSSQALNLTEPVTASFELALPGHSPKTPGQDLGAAWFVAKGLDFAAAPATTEWVYDAARTFPLLMQQSEGLVASKSYDAICRSETVAPDEAALAADPDAEPQQVESCAVIFNEEGRDDVYRLHLRPEDTALLGLTESLAAYNPDLDANHEIAGELRYRLVTPQLEYQDNVADNVAALPVVFMAPEAGGTASENDLDDGGVSETENAAAGPYAYVIKDDLTTSGFGNDWFGGGYRLENSSSADKKLDVVTGNYRSSGARVYATLLKQEITILGIAGNVDWNYDNALDLWKAGASLTVMNYTVLNAAFTPSYCNTAGQITYCPLFESEPGADPAEESKKSDSGDKADEEDEGSNLSKEWKWLFMAGPVPLTIQAEVAIKAGITFAGKFLIDKSGLVPKYGVEFAVGPYVGLAAQVFGGITIGVARAGVEGNLTILKVSFMPTLRPLARLAYDSVVKCWRYADVDLTFEGPLKLTGPSGDVSVVAYIGFKVCLWKCYKFETKVFSFTIASFSTFEKVWMLWSITKSWSKVRGDSGMCADAYEPPAETVWRSPTSCSGQYCNSSSTGTASSRSPSKVLAAYKKTVDLAGTQAHCVDVKVKGTTEASKDAVVIYDEAGAVQNNDYFGQILLSSGWSGSIDKTLRVCSPKVTVALETNGSVTRDGVTVTFTPVL